MSAAFAKAGVKCLTIDEGLTRYGAVETTKEGLIYADFLEEHHGEYDGLVICLPNFGDENGIKAAIKDVKVPILIQAYPDEIGKMDFEHRRDAFCGKLGLTSVLVQMGIKYTAYMPFTVHPLSDAFDEQLRSFIGVCRVVKGMRNMRVGALGARTTAFKSVRYDECALENRGIDVETYDLSGVLAMMDKYDDNSPEVRDWVERLENTADFSCAPAGKATVLAKLGAVMEEIAVSARLDALAIRCWSELQKKLEIVPCSLIGILNQKNIPCACEMDVTNAIMMRALNLASGSAPGCLDINNNYGDDLNKCILFHCGPLPSDLMTGRGQIQDHKLLSKGTGKQCSWGLNAGKMITGGITVASARTESGKIQFYVDKGELTGDKIEDSFFGVSGVFTASDLQRKLYNISESGFRHHATVCRGDVVNIIAEALTKYLGYERININR